MISKQLMSCSITENIEKYWLSGYVFEIIYFHIYIIYMKL